MPTLIQSPDFDPQEMARRGRIGAHVLHSRYDSRDLTAPAREKFLSRFEREVDPTGSLDPTERARRAGHARKTYFARLAHQSDKARAAKKSAQSATVAASGVPV